MRWIARVLVLVPGITGAQAALPLAPASAVTTVTASAGYFTEPSIAVDAHNPAHVVAAYQDNAHAAWSADSGRTWTVASGTEPPNYRVSGDVSVTFDRKGHAILCYMAFDRLGTAGYWAHGATRGGIFVRRSLDGGRTWERDHVPILEHPSEPGVPWEDKPYIVADNTDGPYSGNLYVGWTHFTLERSDMFFSRSTDDGRTWSAPIVISSKPGLPRDDNGDVEGFSGTVAPDGTLYTVWSDRTGISLAVSHDGGKSFAPSHTVIETGPANFSIPGFTRGNGFPQVGLDPRVGPNGRLFVTWSDFSNGDFDVFSATSTDGGTTWSSPARVNTDAKHDGKDQFFQWLAVDPTDGAEYALFYDRRADSLNVHPAVTLARSTDGGQTFANYAWTQTPFDARHSSFVGDYSGIAAYGGRVYGIWTEEAHTPAAPPPASGRPRPNTIIRIGVADFQKNTVQASGRDAGISAPAAMTTPPGSAVVEQTSPGTRPPVALVASFTGLGADFVGPQGNASLRSPSDNTLAVGPDHIVQIVNARMAIFTKKGRRFDSTGKVLYGPVQTNNVFRGFGGPCEAHDNGDAVVRYDQLADRWLIVMPIFTRGPVRPDEPSHAVARDSARLSQPGQAGQPGAAVPLYQPPAAAPTPLAPIPEGPRPKPVGPVEHGSYAMCYALSTGSDPMGPYYRYEFVRPFFPDYPRPAIWPDGYYLPSSTGDDVVQKQACVVDRAKMLKGEAATEQCVIIDGVNFLNNADIDGKQLPPAGAPNIMMAAGGTQLKNIMEDDGIYVWKFHVDWSDPTRTRVDGPVKIPVAPYHYLCDGQLTSCVPQPGTERRLDAQGDKLMARLVYRRIGRQESIVAVHSVNTSAQGGGVRWYEFRLDGKRDVSLYQQGTYAPGGSYRWLASPAMDASGNIGIGYSFGGTPHFAGQRFAGRLANDPKGTLTLRETVLAEGEGAQVNTLRWEDYTQTAIDPTDDCTVWYTGDYVRKNATSYSTRIGAFRMPGCSGSR